MLKTNETQNGTTPEQTYIDSEFIFLFNYLNRTLPFFFKNETVFVPQPEQDSTSGFFSQLASLLVQMLAVVVFVFVSSYLTLKLLSQEETMKISSSQAAVSPTNTASITSAHTTSSRPLVEATSLSKDNSCQTSNANLNLISQIQANKRDSTLSQSLLEVNRPEINRPLHPFDLYGSKSKLNVRLGNKRI